MDTSMKGELNALLEDVMTCPMNDRADLYVVMDSIRYVTPQGADYLVDERVLVYSIKASPGYPLNQFGRVSVIEHQTVSPKPPVLLGHALQRVDKLTAVLKGYVPVNDAEVLMITWDHGSGFGIFRQTDPDGEAPELRSELPDELEGYPYLKLFYDKAMEDDCFAALMNLKSKERKGMDLQDGHRLYHVPDQGERAFDFIKFLREKDNIKHFRIDHSDKETDWLVAKPGHDWQGQGDQKLKLGKGTAPEILKNGELAQVISKWLGCRKNKKVGVLLMMNCWMMNLHTMYSLRDTVKYLVAPEGGIDSPGYHYAGILESIYRHSPLPIGPEELAGRCIDFSHDDELVRRAAILNPEFKNTVDFRAIFAMRLDFDGEPSPFDKLIKNLTGITNDLRGLLDPAVNPKTNAFVSRLMKYVRALSFEFTGNLAFLVDIPNFLQALNAATDHVDNDLLNSSLGGDLANTKTDAQALTGKPAPYIGPLWYTIFSPPPTVVASLDFWKLTGTNPTGSALFFPIPLFGSSCDTINLLDNVASDELLNGPLNNWKTVISQLFADILKPPNDPSCG